MRFSLAESMIDPSFYLPIAQAADDAGWDGMVVPDSICYPKESDSTYPYTPDGSREFLEEKPFIEPFSLIPAMAAVTERMRFSTFVVKLPIRHPVLVAKQATSVGVITSNRFAFGIGTSPWPEDYAVTDTEWRRRGARTNEMIEIIRGLGTGDYYEHHGEFYDFDAIKLNPVPTEPVPILVGGHSKMAFERAARLGDGWMHAGSDMEELPTMLAEIDRLRAEYGRENLPFERHVISLEAYTPDGVKRLEDAGITDVIVGFSASAYERGPDTEPLQNKLDNLRGFAETVIAEVRRGI